MGFYQSFHFPNDVFKFGKHTGQTIGWVIDNKKTYYDWLMTQGLSVSYLITEYRNGLNNEPITKINHNVNKKTDKLTISLTQYWLLKAEKFIRKKPKMQLVKIMLLGVYDIKIPFTITTETKKEFRDYTKFHNDCEEVEFTVTHKHYDAAMLSSFIKEKIEFHKQELNDTTKQQYGEQEHSTDKIEINKV